MAIHAPITGAPVGAPTEFLSDASCWLEQAAAAARVLAQHLEASRDLDADTVALAYGVRSLVMIARGAISEAESLVLREGR